MGVQSSIVGLIISFICFLIVRPIEALLDSLQGYYNPKKNHYLQGNFAPVHKELTAYDIPVKHGAIPKDLAGEFVRNGPNPVFAPKGGYHWFDGDGMLHGVRMSKDGKVSYINRWVQTNLLKNEATTGIRWRVSLGEMQGKLGLVKILFQKLKYALGITSPCGATANTALVFHNKKLQALLEADVPYEIRVLYDGQFETAARLDYNGRLKIMTAHPKVDPETGELFFFSYGLLTKPYLQYGYIDKLGNLVRTMEIDIPEAVMMHDFAITEKHALFLDLSFVIKKERIFSGKLISFDPSHHPRVGILDRYAKDASNILWFTVPQCISFHTANAWEDGDEVVLVTCRSINTFDFNSVAANKFGLAEWRFNMKTREFSEQLILPGIFCEFPNVNPSVIGRKHKYLFIGTGSFDAEAPTEFDGILKIDLDTKQLIKKFTYGPNKYAGEAVFVPKSDATSEDDGYLLTFVFDKPSNSSSFWIVDAKSMTDIVAIVDLPQRVPYGFHGLFVSEAEILSQLQI